MAILASPRTADSVSTPRAGAQGQKAAPKSTKKPAVGSPNVAPPPKYEMPEDWPVEGAIDLGLVRASTCHIIVLHRALGLARWPQAPSSFALPTDLVTAALRPLLLTQSHLPAPQHDLPHASSSLEWWYHNAHITTTCGKEITLFSSFFRLVTGYDEKTKQLQYGHGA